MNPQTARTGQADGPGYAVIDLETTGVGKHDRIIEVGVVLLRPDLTVESTWETLVQPERDIPNSFIHKITATDVVDAPTFAEIAPYLSHLLNGRFAVAHNAPFEQRFLRSEFDRVGVFTGLPGLWLDTMRLSDSHLGVRKLSEALAIADIKNSNAHSALADAYATADLLRYLHLNHRASLAGCTTAEFANCSPSPPVRALPRGGAGGADDRDSSRWVGRLAQTLPETSAPKDEAAYRAELTRTLVDRHISRSEIRQLEKAAVDSGLSADDVNTINEEFLRQLVVEAWTDGVITDEERSSITAISDALEVDQAAIEDLLAQPQTGDTGVEFALEPGDRVSFTGVFDMPRETWERRALVMGLQVGDVTKTTKVLVSANPDSMSGKAQKARDKGVPIIGEARFAQLISDMKMTPARRPDPASQPHPAPQPPSQTDADTNRFAWLTQEQRDHGGISKEAIAAAWIAMYPHAALSDLSPDLSATTPIEKTRTGIDRYIDVWQDHYPAPLTASAADLLALPGVGEKRRYKLVELAVNAALEAPAKQAAAQSISSPQPVSRPTPRPVPPEPDRSHLGEPIIPRKTSPTKPVTEKSEPEPSTWLPEPHRTAPVPGKPTPKELENPHASDLKTRPNRAAKVFKWSAVSSAVAFLIFTLLILSIDPDGESWLSMFMALIWMISSLSVLVSGPVALFTKVTRK
ncbi:hypothetical protein KBX10_10990 [Corynebacterium sp. CCUG 59401]|nr:hypothetical protein [Corynebacterium pseudogenitalium]